jgi:hypothetical protein
MEKTGEMHLPAGNKIYRDQLITVEDLNAFKADLLDAIKDMLASSPSQSSKKWIKSLEVKKMLNISTGTLQNLRVNGTLPFTKIGGLIYYDSEDIHKMLSKPRPGKSPSVVSPKK